VLGSVLTNYDSAAADYDRDGDIDISDVIALINRIVNGV